MSHPYRGLSQKFISTLLSDILTILGIIWACKVFLDCFYNYLKKQPSSQVEKIYVTIDKNRVNVS
jgi:hypothetical protein